MTDFKAELEKTTALLQEVNANGAELEQEIEAALTTAPEKVARLQADISNNDALKKRYLDRIEALKAQSKQAELDALKDQSAAITEHHISVMRESLQRYEKAVERLDKAYSEAIREQESLFAVRPRSLIEGLWNHDLVFPVLPLSKRFLEIRKESNPENLKQYRKLWDRTKSEIEEAIKKMYRKELDRAVQAAQAGQGREIKIINPPN
jgi:hypothetical protein